MAPRFIAEQLSHPRGIRGWLVRRGMNRGNAQANQFALDQLDLRSTDTVLEIGFGGGVNIQRLLDQSASVVGVDRSQDAVKSAERHFAEARSKGRASFLLGQVEALPLPDDAFTKAVTVHTVYFWTSLHQGFRELHRCLLPGGLLAVGFLPKAQMDRMRMPEDLFTTREPDALTSAASKAGFTVDMRQPERSAPWRVILCRKADA